MPRDWKARVQDILDAGERIGEYTEGLDEASFVGNAQAVHAVAYNLLVIGEAAAHVPEELVQRTASIPWRQMRGMRNLIVHEYYLVDPHIVWRTATVNLEPAVQALRALME